MFNVNAKLFEAAHRFISTEEARYYLNGVSIEPCEGGGVAIVATDGHRMFVAYDATGVSRDRFIVRADKALLTACRKGEHLATGYDGDGKMPSVASVYDAENNVQAAGPVSFIDGTSPDWRRVIPQDPEPEVAAWDSKYISEFAKVAKDLSRAFIARKCGTFAIYGGATAPALVQFEAGVPAFGVLMPLRANMTDPQQVMSAIDAAPVKDTDAAKRGERV